MTFSLKSCRLLLWRTLTETEKTRFKLLNKLVKYKLIVLLSGCWIKEGTNISKYSTVIFCGEVYRLHVLSAILFNNHDTELHSLHKCDIEACCNPSHLYSGTNHDNAKDRKFRKENGIQKGEVINRIEISDEKFELDFLPDEKIN